MASMSAVKIAGQRRARGDNDDEVDPVLAAQRSHSLDLFPMITQHQQQQKQKQHSKNWNDMPYAALRLIADYHCVKASDALLLVGCVCKRWHDAAVNYLPADAWRRFYHRLVFVHYQIPEKQIAEAKLPTPNTLQTYSDAARYWQLYIDDARALRETFCGVEKMPDSWKTQALGTVAEWEGVKSESDRVTNVILSWNALRGSVDFTKLPTKMQILWLHGNELSGSIDLTQLPVGLQSLSLDDNKLSGSIDLTRLPEGLQSLWLHGNQFSGSVDLTRLPAGLQRLHLDNNKFSSSVDLTQLPASLVYLYLYDNQFSGSIDLSQLPEKLQDLRLNNNKFAGSTSVNNKKCEVKVDDTVEIKK